jgi:hypothetical protein
MAHPLAVVVLASGVHWGTGWKWTGNFTTLDLIAAATNALNGALLPGGPATTRTTPSSGSSRWPCWAWAAG